MCKEKLEGMGDQGRRQGRQCVWAWETEEGYETARSSHGEGQELHLPPLGPLGRCQSSLGPRGCTLVL